MSKEEFNNDLTPELDAQGELASDQVVDPKLKAEYDTVDLRLKKTEHQLKLLQEKRNDLSKALGIDALVLPSKSELDKKRVKQIMFSGLKDTQENADKLDSWMMTFNSLKKKGVIKDSNDCVKAFGIRLASKSKQDQVESECFPSNRGRIDEYDLDAYMKKNDGVLEKFNFRLESKDFMKNIIYPKIQENFEGVENNNDLEFILKLINPDLPRRFFLKDGFISYDEGYGYDDDGNEMSLHGGLFLVGK